MCRLRRLRRITGQCADSDRIQTLETVVLNDHDRPRFSCVTAAACRDPQIPSFHSTLILLMASIKP